MQIRLNQKSKVFIVLLIFAFTFAYSLRARAEAFGPLADVMHAMSSDLEALTNPGGFFGLPLPAIQDLKAQAAKVLGNTKLYAPTSTQGHPDRLKVFTDYFAQIERAATDAEASFGTASDKISPEQAALCASLIQTLNGIAKSAHAQFAPPPLRPVRMAIEEGIGKSQICEELFVAQP